jgi:hypothetical protein
VGLGQWIGPLPPKGTATMLSSTFTLSMTSPEIRPPVDRRVRPRLSSKRSVSLKCGLFTLPALFMSKSARDTCIANGVPDATVCSMDLSLQGSPVCANSVRGLSLSRFLPFDCDSDSSATSVSSQRSSRNDMCWELLLKKLALVLPEHGNECKNDVLDYDDCVHAK